MRLSNWPTLLAAFLTHRQSQPFCWGKNDCCLFAADAINVITGVDHASAFRGRYTTAIGAKRALIRYGKGDIKHTFIAKFGTPIGVLNASRGDVALVNINGENVVGMVFGNIYVVSEHGLLQLPLSHAMGIWSIS
jgi:hypothetical protein